MQTPNFRHVRTCRIVRQILGRVILPLLTGARFVSEIRILRSADGSPELGLVQTRGVLKNVRIVRADFYASEFFFNPDQVKTFSIRSEHMQSARAFMDDLPCDKAKVFIHVRRGDYRSGTTSRLFYIQGINPCKRSSDIFARFHGHNTGR